MATQASRLSSGWGPDRIPPIGRLTVTAIHPRRSEASSPGVAGSVLIWSPESFEKRRSTSVENSGSPAAASAALGAATVISVSESRVGSRPSGGAAPAPVLESKCTDSSVSEGSSNPDPFR